MDLETFLVSQMSWNAPAMGRDSLSTGEVLQSPAVQDLEKKELDL